MENGKWTLVVGRWLLETGKENNKAIEQLNN